VSISNRQHLAALDEHRAIIRRQETALCEARGALARVEALAARWDVVADQAMFGEHRDLVTAAATSLRAALDGGEPT